MNKILWDFEIQTDHPITVIRPDLVLINKNLSISWFFFIPADHSENKRKVKDRQIF